MTIIFPTYADFRTCRLYRCDHQINNRCNPI